jgi:pimeloyl-ACP methyl ester carboxylesterase
MGGVAAHELAAWQARGQRIRMVEGEVFALAAGEERAAAPLLILHGFPTSSFDFHLALPHLMARHRVVLHDHLGFGLSDKPADYSYSLLAQADVALGVWRSLGIARGHLLAHDYGTSVATELLARRERGLLPIELLSLTLSNGSVHLELARPRRIQWLLAGPFGPLVARFSGRRIFQRNMKAILGRPDGIPEDELDALWEGLVHSEGRRRLPALAGYLRERVRFRERWIPPLTRLDLPTHILWGRRDPIALAAVAEALASEIPGARLTWLDELGHYPMLEDPERWSAGVLGFLSGLP